MEPMSLITWVLVFSGVFTFLGWIVLLGGAEYLEGSMLSGFLLHERAPFWSAYGLRLFAGLNWSIAGVWFAVGVFVPSVRLPWF